MADDSLTMQNYIFGALFQNAHPIRRTNRSFHEGKVRFTLSELHEGLETERLFKWVDVLALQVFPLALSCWRPVLRGSSRRIATSTGVWCMEGDQEQW
jgi:hypothetical protein